MIDGHTFTVESNGKCVSCGKHWKVIDEKGPNPCQSMVKK